MSSFLRGWRYAAVAALALAPLAVACGSAQPTTGSGEDAVTDEELSIEFPEMYSAFGGDHEFQVPARVDGVKNVKWSADPADAVSFAKQDDGSVMITMKKFAPTVTITAKAAGLKSTAKLHMTQSDDELWKQGSERYNNGVVFKRPDGGGGGRGDGGPRGERVVDKKLACTNCHAKGGQGSDVEHTPTQTGGFSDEELVDMFTKGVKPEGVKMRVMTEEKWKKIHTWEMDEDEKAGLVVYLRALTPESQGTLDFGGGIFGKGGRHRDENQGGSKSEDKGTDSKTTTDDKTTTN